jgi:hypothetical protein
MRRAEFTGQVKLWPIAVDGDHGRGSGEVGRLHRREADCAAPDHEHRVAGVDM